MHFEQNFTGSSNERKSSLRIADQENSSQYFKEKNDSEIWEMFKEGHVGAFRYIYLNYFNILFSYGCRITSHSEVVKDCIQELFVELRRSQKLSPTENIKFYLFRALKWKIYRKIENRKRFLNVDNEVFFEIGFEESHESVVIHAQTYKIRREKLKSAITNLTNRQKEALYYFYDQNLNYDQVASLMKLSNKKSARNLIYKAIGELKKILLAILLLCFQ